MEVKQDEDKTVYKNLEDIGDDLPDHSPRFVLLSYPLTLVSCTALCGSVVPGRQWIEKIEFQLTHMGKAFWTAVSAICDAILSPRHCKRGVEDVICGSQRVDEKYGRGREGS